MPWLRVLFSIVPDVLASVKRERLTDWKGRTKNSIFEADNMLVLAESL